MALAACLVLTVALAASADVSRFFQFWLQQNQQDASQQPAPQGNLPTGDRPAAPAKQQNQASSKEGPPRAEHLSEGSRLAIIRAISGEFAKASIALPGGKSGLRIPANQPFQPPDAGADAIRDAADKPSVIVAVRAPAVRAGDQVQITRIEFRDREIVFDLNGGGRQRTSLRDHIHIDFGGPWPTSSVQQTQQGASGVQKNGVTLILDYGRKLPDLTPEDIKLKLAAVLDFSKQRSAAVQYAQTLPPEFAQAVKNRIAAVGMDRDMVLAAMGRPERKVRQRDADGNETEDWIFGTPPGKTVFVTFISDKVVRVKQFP
jgi:hypothetical protein